MDKSTIYKSFLKRPLDFIGALTGLIVSSPLLLVVGIILGIQNRGKLFFRQERIGKNDRSFSIIKFRTMTDERDKNGNLLPDHLRMTSIGKWIRMVSLDELPQFFNILKGEMSFIGPRPLLPEYIPLYNARQRRRHEVTPGITGWAQCHGRNAITWREKLDYDVWYVDNLSISIDCKIVVLTIKTMLDFKNSNSQKEDIEKFNGHN